VIARKSSRGFTGEWVAAESGETTTLEVGHAIN